jgi:hypothetical protein
MLAIYRTGHWNKQRGESVSAAVRLVPAFEYVTELICHRETSFPPLRKRPSLFYNAGDSPALHCIELSIFSFGVHTHAQNLITSTLLRILPVAQSLLSVM